MRKLFYLLLPCLILFSCEKETILTVDQYSFSFAENGGSQTVTLTANKPWTASVDQSWCKVSPSGGEEAASSKITITCETNTTYDVRNCNIMFTCAELTKTVSITQNQSDGLIVTSHEYIVSNARQTLSIDVNTNVEFEVFSDSNWVQYVETKALSGKQIILDVSKNETYSNREAVVTVKQRNGDLIEFVSITQNGNILESPTGISAKINGSSVLISWNDVAGATEYNVYRNSSSTGSFSLITTVSGTTASDNNPLSGSNYYKITAKSGSTESDYSSTVSVSVSKKPATPTGLRAVQNGNAINVSWNGSSGAEYYRLFYKRPAPYDIETFENIYSTSARMEWNTMIAGIYTFWIVAVGSDYAASDASSKVTCNFTINDGSGNTGGSSSQSKLDTPKNIEANSGERFVQISFDEVPLAYQYELYRSTSATSGYTKISASGGSISGNRYVLTDSNPKTGTTYYKVKAVALSYLGIADSDFSAYVKVTR